MGVKLSTSEARVLRERRGNTLCGRCRGSQTVGVKTPWESNGGSQKVGVKTPWESSVGVVCALTRSLRDRVTAGHLTDFD